jgi:hypothetical protein
VITPLVENATVGVEPALTTSAVMPTSPKLRTAAASAASGRPRPEDRVVDAEVNQCSVHVERHELRLAIQSHESS